MSIYLDNLSFENMIKSAPLLKPEDQYKLILKLLGGGLGSTELEDIVNTALSVLEQVRLREEQEQEFQATFDISLINDNYYAYIRHWGLEKYVRIYMGPIRILEGITYRLTHKKTKEIKVVKGLGLRREGDQVLMDIAHLYPNKERKSYVFYDHSLQIPTLPRLAEVDPLFGKKFWEIEEIDKLNQAAPQLTSTVRESVEIDPKPVNQTPQAPSPKVKRVIDLTNRTSSKRKEQVVVKVETRFTEKVRTCMEQWEEMSKAVPNYPAWILEEDGGELALVNLTGEVLVSFNLASRNLKTVSADRLYTMFRDDIIRTLTDKALPLSQNVRKLLKLWTDRLEYISRRELDRTSLLTHLFYLN